MPLFGPLEGSEGTILIPERGPRGDLGKGAGLRGFGPQIALCGALRGTGGRSTRHP